MQSLCTFSMLLLSAPPLSALPLNISLHILSSPPLHLFSKKHISASLCAPPLKPLTLTLSAPPVWTLSLNGWEDTYKGRYRLKNRECSMGNSSNQSLSGPLLHHSVYLLSTFFLWTCRTISLPYLSYCIGTLAVHSGELRGQSQLLPMGSGDATIMSHFLVW